MKKKRISQDANDISNNSHNHNLFVSSSQTDNDACEQTDKAKNERFVGETEKQEESISSLYFRCPLDITSTTRLIHSIMPSHSLNFIAAVEKAVSLATCETRRDDIQACFDDSFPPADIIMRFFASVAVCHTKKLESKAGEVIRMLEFLHDAQKREDDLKNEQVAMRVEADRLRLELQLLRDIVNDQNTCLKLAISYSGLTTDLYSDYYSDQEVRYIMGKYRPYLKTLAARQYQENSIYSKMDMEEESHSNIASNDDSDDDWFRTDDNSADQSLVEKQPAGNQPGEDLHDGSATDANLSDSQHGNTRQSQNSHAEIDMFSDIALAKGE